VFRQQFDYSYSSNIVLLFKNRVPEIPYFSVRLGYMLRDPSFVLRFVLYVTCITNNISVV
jgi:hypothetical protein